jgi:hypothetical protein
VRNWRCAIGWHHWRWTTRRNHGGWLHRTRTCHRCLACDSVWIKDRTKGPR